MYPFCRHAHFLYILIFSGTETMAASLPPLDLSEPVTLSAATAWAIERDPDLRRIEAEAEAADGQIDQAGRRPNPVIGTEIENVLGTGSASGLQSLEITLGVSQLIETADKRAKRQALAISQRVLIDWDREFRLAEIEASVREDFLEVLLLQKTLELRREQVALAERSAEETTRMVALARASLVEATRARLAVRQHQFTQLQAERALNLARNRLAADWGLIPVPVFEVSGSLHIEPVPAFEVLFNRLPTTAEWGRFEDQEAVQTASIHLEEARGHPDFVIFAGSRYHHEGGGEAAFVLGLELPWPVSDRNQGNLRTARAQLRALKHERASFQQEQLKRLLTVHRQMADAYADAQALENDLRPATVQTLAEVEAGYEEGQFSQLAVLESRQALFTVREAYLDALARYAAAQVQIEKMTRPALK